MSAPVVRSPRDVVDLRVWFREQWREGGTFDRVAVAGLMQRSGSTDRERRSWSRWEHQTFGNATLWWVGEDMVDLLLASARGVPDDVTLDDVPKPSNAGLVVFAKPWFGHDAVDADNTVQVDAFVWGGTLLSPGVRPETPTDGLRAVSMSHYRRLDFDEGLGQNDLALAVETGAIEHARPDFNPTL